ncbi:hypothetical protein [Candidatus Poriferisodalis sp.]|uniref:hypothetical protein n=1 Tax=Candidatus Poriferisodalis sp. TaxID=3101277 RepID=UPI003B0273FC
MPKRRPALKAAAMLAKGEPVLERDLKWAEIVEDELERLDGPPEDPKSAGGHESHAEGTGVKANPHQRLTRVACLRPLWELADEIQAGIDAYDARRKGPKRTWGAGAGLVFAAAVEIKGNAYDVHAEFVPDPDAGPCESQWPGLVEHVARSWSDKEKWRLSPVPFDRHKFYRFRRDFLTDDQLTRLRTVLRDATLQAALQAGALDPHDGSRTHPGPRQTLSSDGSWLRAIRLSTNPEFETDNDAAPPAGLYDPDAMPYHHNNRKRASAPGHQLSILAARSQFTQENFIIDHYITDPRSDTRNDGTHAVDMILALYEDHRDQLKDVLRALVHDMALSPADHDRLFDAGLLGISKVPRKIGNVVSAAYLGEIEFTAPDGTKHTIDSTAFDGTPTIRVADGMNNAYRMPLVRKRFDHRERKTVVIYADYEIPDHPLVPQRVRGAIGRIRLNSTDSERKTDPHTRRTRAFRAIPESDPDFKKLYGPRENTESHFRRLKRHMPDKRCKTIGRTNVDFGILAYRLDVLANALVAYRKRTGADISYWFGSYFDSG